MKLYLKWLDRSDVYLDGVAMDAPRLWLDSEVLPEAALYESVVQPMCFRAVSLRDPTAFFTGGERFLSVTESAPNTLFDQMAVTVDDAALGRRVRVLDWCEKRPRLRCRLDLFSGREALVCWLSAMSCKD